MHFTCGPVFFSNLTLFFFFSRGSPNKHGFHLLQAMRFAVEEINSKTGVLSLLPGVKLGYQMYDICSVPASILATLDLLDQQYRNISTPGAQNDTAFNSSDAQTSVAVIGPDSSSNSFTPAALLGTSLVPQVS